MKKTVYRVALLLMFLIIVFALLLHSRPELMKVMRYQNPDAQTYKIFPQAVVAAADTPFYFTRADSRRKDLDTVSVLDNKHQLVPFKKYFEDGKLSVFMVIRDDTIIYERCADGYSDTTLATLFSVGKSMTSVLLGKALAEGKIKSLDDLLISYVPELKSSPAFEKITLKHLLTMKSGLEFTDTESNYLMSVFSDEARYFYTDDIKKQLLGTRLAEPPGTFYKYRSIDVLLLSWAIENATGQKTARYFQDKIWKAIGAAHPASWGLDHQNGFANTASRFQATAIDLAKVGRLYLNKGKYNGVQVIPEDWVNQSVYLNKEAPALSKYWQKTTFHYLWWLPQLPVNGDFSAEGTRGQRLYVDPVTRTIIVQFASKGGGDFPYRKISRYLAGLPFDYPE
jgi:CubicO group peptidase (beta-lactamase class C family)